MPPTDYQFSLSADAYVPVHFSTIRGKIVEFVMKLYVVHDGYDYEVIRYDTVHGGVYKDVLFPDGSKYVVVPYHYLNNEDGLTFAVQDVSRHRKFYIEMLSTIFIYYTTNIERNK